MSMIKASSFCSQPTALLIRRVAGQIIRLDKSSYHAGRQGPLVILPCRRLPLGSNDLSEICLSARNVRFKNGKNRSADVTAAVRVQIGM